MAESLFLLLSTSRESMIALYIQIEMNRIKIIIIYYVWWLKANTHPPMRLSHRLRAQPSVWISVMDETRQGGKLKQ